MKRLIVLFIFLLGHLDLLSQEVIYRRINTIEGKERKGSVTITDKLIIIYHDSTSLTLPIIAVTEYKNSICYILEGCEDGMFYKGLGMYSPQTSSMPIGGGHRRYFSSLWIELRSKREYTSTRYSLYYDE